MALRLRRGTNAQRLLITPAEGELIYTTDTKRLWIGDGSTVGGVLANTGAAYQLNDLIDVDLTTVLPETGDVLKYDGTKFVAAPEASPTEPGGNYYINIENSLGQTILDADNATFSGNAGTVTNGVYTVGNQTIGGTKTFTSAINGNVVGTLYGSVFGDVRGSVFGDDSSVIVDSVNNLVVGNIASSNIKLGSVDTPDLEIKKESNIIKLYVSAGDYVQALADRFYVGSVAKSSQLRVYKLSDVSDQTSIYLTTYRNDNVGGRLDFLKSRGDGSSFTSIADGDVIGTVRFQGDDGTGVVSSAQIVSEVDGVVSTGKIPGKLRFSTADSLGTMRQAAEIGSDQIFTINTAFETRNANFNLKSAVSTQTSKIAQFDRSRGSNTAPTVVQNSDHIYSLRFAGHDGTDYRLSSQIRGEVAGVPSAGIVPGQIRIMTTDSTGATQTAILVKSDQNVTFNGPITVKTFADATARDTAIPTPTAGMIIFNTGTGKFQGNVDGLVTGWQDLN